MPTAAVSFWSLPGTPEAGPVGQAYLAHGSGSAGLEAPAGEGLPSDSPEVAQATPSEKESMPVSALLLISLPLVINLLGFNHGTRLMTLSDPRHFVRAPSLNATAGPDSDSLSALPWDPVSTHGWSGHVHPGHLRPAATLPGRLALWELMPPLCPHHNVAPFLEGPHVCQAEGGRGERKVKDAHPPPLAVSPPAQVREESELQTDPRSFKELDEK